MTFCATIILLPTLAALSSSPERPAKIAPIEGRVDQRLVGGWTVEESSAVFVIHAFDGRMVIHGVDASDGEAFDITDAKWDGKTFSGTFRMPSSNWTTHSALRFESTEVLWGAAWGDVPGIVEERWRKLPPPEHRPRERTRWVGDPGSRPEEAARRSQAHSAPERDLDLCR